MPIITHIFIIRYFPIYPIFRWYNLSIIIIIYIQNNLITLNSSFNFLNCFFKGVCIYNDRSFRISLTLIAYLDIIFSVLPLNTSFINKLFHLFSKHVYNYHNTQLNLHFLINQYHISNDLHL